LGFRKGVKKINVSFYIIVKPFQQTLYCPDRCTDTSTHQTSPTSKGLRYEYCTGTSRLPLHLHTGNRLVAPRSRPDYYRHNKSLTTHLHPHGRGQAAYAEPECRVLNSKQHRPAGCRQSTMPSTLTQILGIRESLWPPYRATELPRDGFQHGTDVGDALVRAARL
jgi:hypothetical protein